MKDINFINKQVDKIIEFDPKKEYSDSYKHPKDRVSDFVSICENEEQIYDVLKLVKVKVDSELSIYEYGDLFGIGVSYYEHYNSFHRDLITEVDAMFELYEFELNSVKSDEIIEVEDDDSDIEKLQYRTKVILLEELGVIDFLKKNKSLESNTDLSKYLAQIVCGVDGNVKKAKAGVRKNLTYLHQKDSQYYPYTNPQVKLVNSILSLLSLPKIK